MEISTKKQKKESCNICKIYAKNYKPDICYSCSIDIHICKSCKNKIDSIVSNVLIPGQFSDDII